MGRTVSVKPAGKGYDTVVSLNGKVLAGQKSAFLNRTKEVKDISNQILKDWATVVPATKSWNVTCTGMFIKDSECFNILENAFINNSLVTIKLEGCGKAYTGSAYISQFPLSANYDDTYSYNLTFIGNGALSIISDSLVENTEVDNDTENGQDSE